MIDDQSGLLTAFQIEVAQLFFSLSASGGFLLAGRGALLAQGLTARPTQDLDFFARPGAGDVGIPPPLIIERDNEQVLALKGGQHGLPVGSTGQRIAQSARHLVENGRVEQEVPDLIRLPVQNLLDEVVQHKPMAPGERLDEPGDISRSAGAGTGTDGQRSQLQASGPPLCTRIKGSDKFGFKLEPHDLIEERLGFVGAEPEVCGSHLDQLAASAQTRQW